MSNTPETVDDLISLDGSERWNLSRHANGLYFASETTLARGSSCAGEAHWVPGRVSCPFDTVQAAQHDALDNLPWFFEALTNNTNGS